jgi:hypothetical protein
MPRQQLDPCIYCGSLEEGTRDHVPPRCLFPRPRPLDTVTVPACRSCNQSYQLDDEHFAVAMGAQCYAEDPEAARVWTSIIRPLLARSPGLRTMLSQQIIDGPVQTPAGIVLPDRIAIRFSAPRIVRVVRRIVRGLLWHHYRHVPASNIELVVFQEQIVHPEVADTLNTRTVLSGVGDTIFRYRHGVASDAPDTSVWALQFYAQTQFIIIVQGESFVSAERESRVTEQLA